MSLIAITLTTLFAFAGQQTAANGSIAGFVKAAPGVSAEGIRVSAVAVPGVAAAADEGLALVTITQTDKTGRYVLENIPPGRYYIAAGFVAAPIFHPGVQETRAATIVTVTAGAA